MWFHLCGVSSNYVAGIHIYSFDAAIAQHKRLAIKRREIWRVYIYIYTVAVWLQELKIKAGAEKLREVATDRKALSDVATIVKKSNSKLNELQAELQQLESQIILTQGQPQSPQQNHSNGQGKA